MHPRSFILLLFTLISPILKPQAPAWQWAHSAGGKGKEYGVSMCTDNSGNVIVTGAFQSTAVAFGTVTITNSDNTGTYTDLFIVKYDPAGNVLWAKSASTNYNDNSTGICTDGSGNIFITGFCDGQQLSLGGNIVPNPNGMYVAKLDPSGNVLWIKNSAGTAYTYGWRICTDISGNVYVGGNFQGNTTFGNISLFNTDNISYTTDVFIVKYDPSGSVLWAAKGGGSSNDYLGGLALDAGAHIILTGSFASPSIAFNTATLTNTSSGGGVTDLFVVMYDLAGNLLWTKKAGGTGADGAGKVTADGLGNIFVSGNFSSTVINFGSTSLTSGGSLYNAFLTKMDALGNVLWARKMNKASIQDLCSDASGNTILTGSFTGLSLSTGTISVPNNNAAGDSADIFVAGYDASGNTQWAEGVGGTHNDEGNSVARDAAGNIFVTGYFNSPVVAFGSNTLSISTPSAGADFFIARLNNGATGIQEQGGKPAFAIYPNPFSREAVLKASPPLHKATLMLFNVMGAVIYQAENFYGSELKLMRQDLPAGLYLLQVLEQDQVITSQKLLIAD